MDVTELLAYRKQVNAKKGVSLTVNDFIVKAVSLALQRTPIMNSAFNEDMSQILVYSNYNISVMTASDKGLVAPVIKESEKKSIYQISEEMKALVEKANAGKLMPEDYAGGTFGVTNLGKLNSFDSVPLPQPPQPGHHGRLHGQKDGRCGGGRKWRGCDCTPGDDEAGHRRGSPDPGRRSPGELPQRYEETAGRPALSDISLERSPSTHSFRGFFQCSAQGGAVI